MKPISLKQGLSLAAALAILAAALVFFMYPAGLLAVLILDSHLARTGESRLVPRWFASAAGRYHSWAAAYLDTQQARTLSHDDVAATEWPMFGSVFFLLTAEELHAQGKIDATQGRVRRAVEKAAEVVASPVTATWVVTKWGRTYLERENVFYRMLLLMGLSSYEQITGEDRYHALMSRQRSLMARELSSAKLHLLDDYPGECYPNDLLWAVAAIQRAARLDGANHDELAASMMAAFDGPLRTTQGVPAFQVDSESGCISQSARGCGNSGILLFAHELDPVIADQWYRAHVAHFWKDTGWIAGFTETPLDSPAGFSDVDSGPVLFGFGSVASAFGIGAAKSAGRLDHAVPLTLEAVACSWPTPFGWLVPGSLGWLAADGGCLGEVALLFSMTRPFHGHAFVPFTGGIPRIVWALMLLYLAFGLFWIAAAFRRFRLVWRAVHRPAIQP